MKANAESQARDLPRREAEPPEAPRRPPVRQHSSSSIQPLSSASLDNAHTFAREVPPQIAQNSEMLETSAAGRQSNVKVPRGRQKWKFQMTLREGRWNKKDGEEESTRGVAVGLPVTQPGSQGNIISDKGRLSWSLRMSLQQEGPSSLSNSAASSQDVDSAGTSRTNAVVGGDSQEDEMHSSLHVGTPQSPQVAGSDIEESSVVQPGAFAVTPGLPTRRRYSNLLTGQPDNHSSTSILENLSDTTSDIPDLTNATKDAEIIIPRRRICLIGIVVSCMFVVGMGASFGVGLAIERPEGKASSSISTGDASSVSCHVLEISRHCRETAGLGRTKEDMVCPEMDEFLRLRSQGSLEFNTSLFFVDNTTAIDWCSPRELSLWFVAGSPETVDRVSRLQQYALGVLFFSASGHHWASRKNWFRGYDHCAWYGIDCDPVKPSMVERLVLTNNRLVGTLPAELGLLSGLDALYIGANSGLVGSLPTELGLLPLAYLFAHYSSFAGTLPTELLSSRSLRALVAPWNELSGSLPTEIGLATNLRWLDVNHNRLTGSIPTELGLCSALSVLWLQKNKLSGSFPSALLSPRSPLIGLDLRGNQMVGTLPSEIGNAKELEGLQLGENMFSGVLPIELSNCRLLRNLRLDQNRFSGTLPPLIFAEMHELNMSHNSFSGVLPSELGGLTSLHSLLFRNNRLSGDIPAQVCSRNLTVLGCWEFSGGCQNLHPNCFGGVNVSSCLAETCR